jgi:hypothetical protein
MMPHLMIGVQWRAARLRRPPLLRLRQPGRLRELHYQWAGHGRGLRGEGQLFDCQWLRCEILMPGARCEILRCEIRMPGARCEILMPVKHRPLLSHAHFCLKQGSSYLLNEQERGVCLFPTVFGAMREAAYLGAECVRAMDRAAGSLFGQDTLV